MVETEVHRLNRQLGQLKSSLDDSQAETRSTKLNLQQTQSELDQLSAQLRTCQQQSSVTTQQEHSLREQLNQLRDEKRQLLLQIAERRDQLDEGARKLERLEEEMRDLRQQRTRDQEEIAKLRSQTSVSDVSEHMLKQSLELAKNQVQWLDGELEKSQTEVQGTKSELSRAHTTGRAEVTRLSGEIEALGEQLGELREQNTQLDRKLRSRLEKERTAREELAEQTEQFKREMAAQKRLCAEWEKTTEASKLHVRSVEESLRELESNQMDTEKKAEDAVGMMEQQVEELETAYSESQYRVSQLEEELANANQLLNDNNKDGSLLLSPTAGAAAKLQQQGKINITQLYSEKVALEDKLKEANQEIECLRDSMDQILAELEERGPIIASEREEYQRLLEDADKIAQDLAEVRKDNLAKEKQLRESQGQQDLLQRQLTLEQQQNKDQARQVTKLLRSVEEARMGGKLLPEKNRSSKISNSDDGEQWLNDVDQVISQKLVTFADISDLVEQNRRLLRTTRELAAQVAQEEEKRREESEVEVKGALEQAEDMLDRLTLELKNTKTRLDVAERERDMVRSVKDKDDVSESPPSPPPVAEREDSDRPPITAKSEHEAEQTSPSSLVQLQSDYDTYKSESRKTRIQLEKEIAKLQNDLSELRVRAAKAESQTQFDADRIHMFSSDLSARQKEIEHLRQATTRLHTQLESYERQLETSSQTIATERAELSKLRRQTTLMEAERDNLRQYEQRWRSEEQRLLAERTSMTQILENTTKMRDEWQKVSEEQVIQAKERLEATLQEADKVRQELKQSRDSHERVQFKLETDIRDLRAQMRRREDRASQLQTQVSLTQEMHTKAQAEKREVEIARDGLQQQVAKLEERIQNHEELMERASKEANTGDGKSVSREALVNVQLQDARSRVESLQSELETTTKRVEDYRQLSETNESSLKQLTDAYDKYKVEQEKLVGEQRAKISLLEADLETTKQGLTTARKELDTAVQTSVDLQSKLNATQTSQSSRITELESEVEQKTKALDALMEDMKRHDDTVHGIQEQLEREIVSHANAITGRLVEQERRAETQKLLATANAELQAIQQTNEQVQLEMSQIKSKAVEDVEAAESQLKEIKRQNSLLLAHLESLGQQVPDISVDPEQIDTAGNGDNLNEVVVYLRRERDLATAQLELAQQETQRWKHKSSYTQQMLDETRKELLQFTPSVSLMDQEEKDGTLKQQTTKSPADIVPIGDGPIMLTATQRQACRQQIEQATLLRESNSVLRADLTTTRARLREIEQELNRVKDQEVPELKSTNALLQGELQSARAHVGQLEGMCEHWKERHEKILLKYQMVDPEEFDALKQENTQLKETQEQLKQENNKLQENASNATEQRKSMQANRAKALQSEIGRLKKQVEELTAETGGLREQLQKAQTDVEAANKAAVESKTKFDKLHGVFQKLRQQSVSKLEQSSQTIKGHEATIQELNEQIQRLAAQIQSSSSSEMPETVSTDEAAVQLQQQITVLAKEKDEALAAQTQLTDDLHKTQELLSEARNNQQVEPASGGDNTAEMDQLKQSLKIAETQIKDYESQLEQLKAKALKYARDNRTLQTRAAELEKKVTELQGHGQQDGSDLQTQLDETKKQLAESEAKIEQAQAKAKKSAELRSKLQISKANKKADDLEKQVAELKLKLEGGTETDVPQKRPSEGDDGPVKKAHVDGFH